MTRIFIAKIIGLVGYFLLPRGRRWPAGPDEGLRFDGLHLTLTPGFAGPSPARERGETGEL